MSARELITEHMDLWTGAVTKKSSSGRGSNGKIELTGVKKLRELILSLGLEGLLTNHEPRTWRPVTLGDIGKWGSGGTPTKSRRDYYGGGIPWLVIGDLNDGLVTCAESSITDSGLQNSSAKVVPPNTLLIAMYGSIGKLGITGISCATNQAIAFCIPDESQVELRFLFLFLLRARSSLLDMGQGLAQQNISQKLLKSVAINLPPLDVQHRIVQKADELMALCDRLEQQTSDQFEAHETLVDTLLGTLTQSEDATGLANNWARLAAHFDTLFTTEWSIDKLKQIILQLAVMGLLEKPTNPEKEPIESLVQNLASERADGDDKTSQRKKKDSPQIASKGFRHPIPENWKWIKFGETWINSFYGPRFAKHDYVPSGGIPTVRTTDMDEKGRIDLRNAPTVLVPEKKKELYLLEKNDILVTRSGSIGVTAVYDLETPAIPSAYLIRLRLCPSINPHYAFIYLNSPHGQKSLGVHSTAVGVPNVNATKMASFDFPLPPKEEQSRIVQKVDELMALCDQLKERLRQASETRCQLAEAVVERALN